MTDKTSGEQYFTTNPNADHHFQQFDFELLDHQLHFTTDSGVFSKSTVDFGTRTMLDALSKRLFRLVKYLTWAQDMDRLALVLPKLTIEKLTWLTLMNELWHLQNKMRKKMVSKI